MSKKLVRDKRESLSIKVKVNIIKLIQTGTSYAIISECYGIGRSTVCDTIRIIITTQYTV